MAADRPDPPHEHGLIHSLVAVSKQDLLALSRPAVRVRAGESCEVVDAIFRREPSLTSVAVVADDGRLGMVTRDDMSLTMSGPLGYGRVLNSRQPVAAVTFWSPLVLDAATGMEEAATRLLLREEHRWDDVLVRSGDELRVSAAADLLQALAGAFAVRATHDELTTLPNRSFFFDKVRACLRDAPADTHVVVVYLDLDGFKQVNDANGHAAGDAVLVTAARRLASAARSGDVVARLGGDEFAVLVELGPGAATQSPRDLPPSLGLPHRAATVGDRFRRALGTNDRQVRLRASVGVALGRPGEADAEALVRDADAAMYAAKHAGGDKVAVADGVGGSLLSLTAQGTLVGDADATARHALQEAIATDQLVLHYQPIVRLRDLRVVSVEALVRWRHPSRGLLHPGQFLPDVERVGLLADLDAWVLDRAARDFAAWGRHGAPGVPSSLNVNLSRASLARPDLVGLIASTLQQHGVAPARLRLELAEDAGTELLAAAAQRLSELRQLGVSLTWDDMGTGASSLRHLTQITVDGLKIDRTFVAEITTSPAALAVVRMLVHLADRLGLKVTAEGVETAQQLELLTELGAGYAQGYHLGRPAPAEDVLATVPPARVTAWARA